jgi:CheY-like chemotaxis protein
MDGKYSLPWSRSLANISLGTTAMKAIRAQHGHDAPYLVVVTASGRCTGLYTMKGFLTNHSAMPGDRERFLDSGFDAYLGKPIHIPELTDIIKQAYEVKSGGPVVT